MMYSKRRTELIKAISELKETDYTKTPELNDIYQRLTAGRIQFEEALEKNINAIMQISALDLTLHHLTEEILEISRSVAAATDIIFGGSSDSSALGRANNQHEELTNTIIHASEKTDEVYKKIELGQTELTAIKELSAQTIGISRQMQKDMNELFELIEQMTGIIAGIDSISMQTNLLSLNASIEASRAGEAGRGFAVVADEIRSLAGETQKLTGSMGEFVEGIRNASEKSTSSVANTIEALQSMTEKIENVWALNDENQNHVSQVNDSISSLAAVSEEISSNMAEMENQLKNNTDFMQNVSSELKTASEPVENIERTLDEATKIMGKMASDAFYHMERSEFSKHISNAITAHKKWLENLRNMIAKKTILPLQLNAAKCGFGHFYYAITPQIPEIQSIWDALESKHRKFHGYGSQAMDALQRKDYIQAEHIYHEAENYSRELISDLEKILALL
ncbi:MAG TPA: hypothetical protein DDY31_08005 [Lachnospiraceae bacterium]|nr:hypothetical protein [Lachnospiraceae bacterium]